MKSVWRHGPHPVHTVSYSTLHMHQLCICTTAESVIETVCVRARDLAHAYTNSTKLGQQQAHFIFLLLSCLFFGGRGPVDQVRLLYRIVYLCC